MNTEELPPLPAEIPPGFSRLTVNASDMDYLGDRWSLKDHGEIFSWAVKMLYDLSKLDEAGWRLTLTKADFNEVGKVSYNPEHIQVYFAMKWLKPTPDGFARLPAADVLDRVTKVTKAQE